MKNHMRTKGLLLRLSLAVRAFPQTAAPSRGIAADPGQRQYDNNCIVCLGSHTDAGVRSGQPGDERPGRFPAHAAAASGPAPVRKKVQTSDGKSMDGLGESSLDLDLRTGDQRVHLFRTDSGGRYRQRTGSLWRRQRHVGGGGCRARQAALAVPDQPASEGVSHDLQSRRQQYVGVASGQNIIAFGLTDQ
jgi:hypothetical protein